MTHTREQLREAYRRLTGFRDLAARAGRTDDAAALQAGADACGAALDRYGRPGSASASIEDSADAAAARADLLRTMEGASGAPDGAEECCPYSQEGYLCATCRVSRVPFTVSGGARRYVCLTVFSTRR